MAECSNFKKNSVNCNCTYSGCSKHGICCECLNYHRTRRELPACYFDRSKEMTYERSIENYTRSI